MKVSFRYDVNRWFELTIAWLCMWVITICVLMPPELLASATTCASHHPLWGGHDLAFFRLLWASEADAYGALI